MYPKARWGSERITVSTFDRHNPQRPQTCTCHRWFPLALVDGSTQTNIVIDSTFHARLTDYGLLATTSDSSPVDFGSSTVRYMAPELLNPSGFNLKNSNPTRKSDIFAFGMVAYQVSVTYGISAIATNGIIQVITREQPFSGAKEDVIVDGIVTGERPSRPSDTNEWVSDHLWNFICRCWYPSWDGRPDVYFVINALNSAADVVEARRQKSHVTYGQMNNTSRFGALYGYLS